MLSLQFGARVVAPTARDPERIVGEYALHLQCPWRISGRAGLVVGAGDMYIEGQPDASGREFTPERPGNAVADLRLREWLSAHAERPITVTGIEVDRCGGFALALSEDFMFEVFPDSFGDQSEDEVHSEYWRLLRPGREQPHFVMRGRRAEVG